MGDFAVVYTSQDNVVSTTSSSHSSTGTASLPEVAARLSVYVLLLGGIAILAGAFG